MVAVAVVPESAEGLVVATGGVVVVVGVMVFGLVEVGTALSPTPNCANGLVRPIVASGTSVILESCKLVKAGSENISTSNLMFLTLSSVFRKF